MNISCSANVAKEIYCNKEDDLCVEPYLPELQATVMLFLSVLICILNGLLILSSLKTETSTSVKTLIITLSLSNVIFAMFIIPVRSFSVFHAELVLPNQLCLLNAFITMFALTLSQLSLMLISIDRYLAICHPLKYPIIVTKQKLAAIVIFIITMSIGVSIPPFFNWGEFCFRPRKMPECRINWKKSASYTIFLICICVIVPITVMFLCYRRISLLAKRHRKEILKQNASASVNSKQSPPNNDIEEDKLSYEHPKDRGDNSQCINLESRGGRNFWENFKTQKIVLLSIGSMIFCWGPNTLTVIWLVFNRENMSLPYSVDFVVTLIAYFSCWINPLLFLILNRDYRVYVKKLFRLSKERSTNDDPGFIMFNTATPETVEIYNTPQMDAKSQGNFHRKLCRQ